MLRAIEIHELSVYTWEPNSPGKNLRGKEGRREGGGGGRVEGEGGRVKKGREVGNNICVNVFSLVTELQKTSLIGETLMLSLPDSTR